MGFGFQVWGLMFWVLKGFGFRVQGLGLVLKVKGSGFRVQCSVFRLHIFLCCREGRFVLGQHVLRGVRVAVLALVVPDVIRKEAWSFYRTISGVRLCWELEEPKGPKCSAIQYQALRPWASARSQARKSRRAGCRARRCLGGTGKIRLACAALRGKETIGRVHTAWRASPSSEEGTRSRRPVPDGYMPRS